MKAFNITECAHPTKIKISDNVKPPVPKKDEILIDVHAVGLNFFDILRAMGKYQEKTQLPFILGTEFSGKVAKNSPIPKGCPFKPGDRVFGGGPGAFADQMALPYQAALPIPDGITYEQAAGMFITYPTSYEALAGRAKAQPGEWVLVHAGAGGVGMAAVQIAKSMGCKVIATASSESKRQICIEKGGADHALDYTAKDWQKQVMKLTGGKGADIVYDPVGLIIPSLKCVAHKARITVIGFAAGNIEKVPANLLLLKNADLSGVFWGGYLAKEPSRQEPVWKELLDLLSQKRLSPVVYDKQYNGLEEIAGGLDDLEKRRTWGKAVVKLRDDAATAKL